MLQFESLQFGYKDRPILKNPDTATAIDFEAAQFITLIGRNGSGKSTLLRVLANLQTPLAGKLTLNGIPYSDYSSYDFAKQLSIVTTERVEFPFLRVCELVALGRHPHLSFGGRLKPNDLDIIRKAMDTVGIAALAQKMITECSDGEKQSAMMARALAQATPVMLLDEITAHLDFVHRHRSFALLKQLAETDKKLILMATHEIELALQYSHRILLLDAGKLSIFSPEEIREGKILEAIFEGYRSNL